MEAISPTLPNEDLRQDLSPFKSTKDDLVQNINRIDREISEAETQIAKLRKKQVLAHVVTCDDRLTRVLSPLSSNLRLPLNPVPLAQKFLSQQPNRNSRVLHNLYIQITE